MLHSDDCQSNIQTKYFSFTKIYNEIKKSKSFIKYKPNFIKDLKCKLFFKHLYKKKSFVIRMGCLIKNILSFFWNLIEKIYSFVFLIHFRKQANIILLLLLLLLHQIEY